MIDMGEKHKLYFNSIQGSMHIDAMTNRAPTGAGWYYVGTYPYEIVLDLGHLYLQIPEEVRKTLGRIEIGEEFYGKDS